MSQEIENIVNTLSEMTERLESMTQGFQQMKSIIGIERNLIAQRDLEAHEKHVKSKTFVGNSIIENAEKMMALWRRVRITMPDKDKYRQGTMTEMLDCLEEWAGEICSEELSRKVLTHMINKLRGKLQDFAQIRAKTSPEIEANAYLVGRLLQQHRDFRAFIQHEIDGSTATYNAKGFQASKESLPMLRVRA